MVNWIVRWSQVGTRTSVNKEITMSDIIRELEKEQLRSEFFPSSK